MHLHPHRLLRLTSGPDLDNAALDNHAASLPETGMHCRRYGTVAGYSCGKGLVITVPCATAPYCQSDRMRGRVVAYGLLLLSACGTTQRSSIDIGTAEPQTAATVTPAPPPLSTSVAITDAPGTSVPATLGTSSFAAVYPVNALWSSYPASA